MQRMPAILSAMIVAFGFMLPSGAAGAQALRQIQLTEQHVLGFIAAQKDMNRIVDKVQGSTSDRPDPKIQAELEAAARKHGFGSFSEYDIVAANITMIMAAIDPQTRAFTDPTTAITKEIEEVLADKTLPAQERQQILKELRAALKVAAPIQYPQNIELVKRYFDQIEAVIQ